jgi:hypothetical protein
LFRPCSTRGGVGIRSRHFTEVGDGGYSAVTLLSRVRLKNPVLHGETTALIPGWIIPLPVIAAQLQLKALSRSLFADAPRWKMQRNPDGQVAIPSSTCRTNNSSFVLPSGEPHGIECPREEDTQMKASTMALVIEFVIGCNDDARRTLPFAGFSAPGFLGPKRAATTAESTSHGAS